MYHDKTIANLTKINKSTNQQLQLEVAGFLNSFYKKAKSYLCFDSGFCNTFNLDLQAMLEYKSNSEYGLETLSIVNKLERYVIKKEAKKVWLIISIYNGAINLTIIKKLKCETSYVLKLDLGPSADDKKDINKINCLKIAQAISQIFTVNSEVFGIIINSQLELNKKIIRDIFKPLAWSGIRINLKSENYIINLTT